MERWEWYFQQVVELDCDILAQYVEGDDDNLGTRERWVWCF